MTKILKRPLSVLLAVLMIASLFVAVPMTAYAAPTESLLITINSVGHGEEEGDGFISGSRTFNNIATVSFSSEVENDDDDDGWYTSGWSNKILSVAPAAGYTITKVKFYNSRGSAFDETSPFEATLYAMEMYVNGSNYGSGGVTKIEVYGYAAPTTYTVTWKNGDTVIETDTEVAKDATPEYNGATPEKAEDENYTYTFTGWTDSSNTFYSKDSSLPAVTKDETYTATFASEDKAVKNVIAQINALPAAAEITAADKAQIEAARAAYEALNGDQKALVTNLDKLTAAETALAAAKKLFPQHSITLGGNIGVNFFINSKTADFASDENAYVKFTWDNGTYNKEVKLKDLPRDNNGNYKATVDVVAAQMAHKIHAEVYLNGEKLDQTDDYSVQDYAETVFNNPTAYDDKGKPDELKDLAQALLNYGAQAQIVFDSALTEKPNPADTVKVVGQTDFSTVTADDIAAAIKGSASDLNTAAAAFDAEFYTSSLIYLSRNTLRLYFTPASKTVGALNGLDFSGNLSEYYYYVDVENIAAAELDNQQTFSVNGTEFTFSALDYAKAVVNSNNMSDTQKDLAKSLYLYNQAANAYFDPTV